MAPSLWVRSYPPGVLLSLALRCFSKGKKGRPNQGLPLLVGRPSFLSSSHISSATYLLSSHGKELVDRPELRSEA